MEKAQVQLDDFVKNLLATLTYVELTVDPKFFKHIIGKSGSNSKKLLFRYIFFKNYIWFKNKLTLTIYIILQLTD